MTGFLCLDKPAGLTSFAAVETVRRLTGEKRAGHTGTLDPMATGVLPVALSGATRFIPFLPACDKAYLARVRLGMTTDTLDITGTATGRSPVCVTREQLCGAAASFVGESLQTPPMYSALRKDGVRLYRLARQGVETEREPRRIFIRSAEVVELSGEEFTLRVVCSAGTYVRSLADDIGRVLGCGAVLSGLRRTASDGFSESDCLTVEQLRALTEKGSLAEVLHPVDGLLSCYGEVTVTAAQARRFRCGGELFKNRLDCRGGAGFYRVYSPQQEFLGLGELKDDSEFLTVKRVLGGA